MDFVLTILYILLFILFLSILVIVHELGHLSMAKIFKVYCMEFSVGFGPKLFSKKKKGGETTVSFRAVPFGGYVSMYGEGAELPDGVTIPESRSLNGVKKWKRAIILVAGVVMNCILAFILFFVSEFAFEQHSLYINQFNVKEDSIAEVAGFQNEDVVLLSTSNDKVKDEYIIQLENNKNFKGFMDFVNLVDKETVITYNDDTTKEAVTLIYTETLSDFEHLSLNYYTYFFVKNDDGVDWDHQVSNFNEIKNISITYKVNPYKESEQSEEILFTPITLNVPVVLNDTTYALGEIGLSFHDFYYRNSYGDSVKLTFQDFGKSSTAIVRSFGMLFTSSKARESVGGIIAIGFETTSVLKNLGFGRFLYIWGLISVNLAIVNLFPFPGLDGWQLLVLLVEAVAHKEIPNKVKNIVSIVGIIIVFALMALLIFKDVFKYII